MSIILNYFLYLLHIHYRVYLHFFVVSFTILLGDTILYKNKASNGRNNISGANIKRLRKSLPEKTSQRAFASQCQLLGLDLDKNAIQRIESGDRFITDIELKVFATYFGVSADDLLKTHDAELDIDNPDQDNQMQ